MFPPRGQRFSAGLALALGLAAAVLAAPSGAQEAAAEARLVVSGEGRVAAAPDMATITLGVQREAETAEAAMAEMSEAARAVLDAVAAAGVAGEEMQTSGLRLSPRFAPQERPGQEPPEVVGYVAETTVTVQVKDLSGLGEVLDGVVAAGANLFRGLSFGIADPQPLQDEARRRAVADAARQAALLSEAAGVALGPLLRLEADAGGPRPMMMRSDMAMAEAASAPIAEGEVTLRAQVRMVYELAAP